MRKNAKVACSLFSVSDENNKLFGRNLDLHFDLKNVLIGQYHPTGGYSSNCWQV